jgi:hypothetical protein
MTRTYTIIRLTQLTMPLSLDHTEVVLAVRVVVAVKGIEASNGILDEHQKAGAQYPASPMTRSMKGKVRLASRSRVSAPSRSCTLAG